MDTTPFLLFLVLAVCAGFLLFEAVRHRRHLAARRAAASIQTFLRLVDPLVEARHPTSTLWEARPTRQGGFSAHLLFHPQSDPKPLPRWIGEQALFLAHKEGLPHARPLLRVEVYSAWGWGRPLGRLSAASAHARIAQRHAVREALAPHLRAAFDADPL